jgi:segregation and condensation protein A
MYEVKVEKFEGPLDLLLGLIEDEKLDITEVSLSAITDKYLNEVSRLDPKTHDVAEFMVVASRLIYLKSKALLPNLETEEEEAEIEELKAKLEIYKKYKEAAREFGSILGKNQRSFSGKKPQLVLSNFTPPKGVDLSDLWGVFNKLITDMPEELKREEVELPSEKITVEEKLADLEKVFATKKNHKFSHILRGSKTKLEAIITFLAILELVKCKQIRVTQSSNFQDIDLVKI